MEKQDFRENYNMLCEKFCKDSPEKSALTVQEAARAMDCNINTVYNAIKRRKDPLPAKKLCGKTVIPIAGFARWLCV